jgi:hypothetical protein
MVLLSLALLPSLVMTSCGDDPTHNHQHEEDNKPMTREDSLEAKQDSLQIDSEYDMSTVDEKDKEEFIENLAKIEEKYGEQWDFCTCVVRQDSVNKAFMNASDAEFDKLMARSDYIDEKCQAFRVQSANQTPEDRAKHEKKVRDCLQGAGIK